MRDQSDLLSRADLSEVMRKAIADVYVRRDRLLAGYIVWLAMQNPQSYWLTQEGMGQALGEWVSAPVQVRPYDA